MGSGGRFKEGVRGLARPWLPLLIENIKASAFKKNFKDFSLNKKYKSKAFKIFFSPNYLKKFFF
ncbi:MAG: hypothetical protein E6838_06940 [Peptoniphilus harei]|nr:hypothetical protein [Peptoniphilus harei]